MIKNKGILVSSQPWPVMMIRFFCSPMARVFLVATLLGCPDSTPPRIAQEKTNRLQIAMVLDSGKVDDRSFNAHALKGARDAAAKHGFELNFTSSRSEADYESHLEKMAIKKPALIFTVGFRMADATARAARRHPELKFAIIDVLYRPGSGCPENVSDCYTEAGGLANVTSLVFAEDQVAYLAGVLAACMSRTGKIASVSGPDILPEIRFVVGFQSGAKSINPKIILYNDYLPSFNDPDMGKIKGYEYIEKGADVLFGLGGLTGCGGLFAAMETGTMAIGVDGDQYYTVPEVRSVLMTSASKNIDTATFKLLDDFAAGKLSPGVRMATLENGGVVLAPFHDWEHKIPDECRKKLEEARLALIADPSLTGAPSPTGEGL